jgi:hypothetical protein
VSSSAAVAAIVLWVVVIIRLRTLPGRPAQKLTLVGLVALAIGFTLDIPQVIAALRDAGAGPNVPHLTKHVMAIVATGSAWEVVRALSLDPPDAATRRPQRLLIFGGAVVALIVLFAAAPVHAEPVASFTRAAVGEPTLLAYWATFLTVLTLALVGIARLCVLARRSFPTGPVRTGMSWVGAGALLGLAYSAHKFIYLATSTGEVAAHSPSTMERWQSTLQVGCVLAFVLGLSWPGAVRWPPVRYLRAYRAYRRLHPLWQAYIEAEPAVAFDDTGKASLRDIELRLYRRVIEIRDGMLAVRPYADGQTREVALGEAQRLVAQDADLVGEAAWLEVARRAKLRGQSPNDASLRATAGGADLATETSVLTRIAKAWPAVQAIADKVETHIETQASR